MCSTLFSVNQNADQRILCIESAQHVKSIHRWLLVGGEHMVGTNNQSTEAAREGTRLLSEGDLDGAISALSESIRLNPTSIYAYRTRAEAYQRMGKPLESQKDLETADRFFANQQSSLGLKNQSMPANEDTAGCLNYGVSFLLAGFLGIGIQYVLRKKGWTGVGVNAIVFVLAMFALALLPE